MAKTRSEPRVTTKMRLLEASLVDEGAMEGADIAMLKRAPAAAREAVMQKRAALTTPMDGHSHLLHLTNMDGNATCGSTSWDGGHSHSWIRGTDGEIVIGEANGHTHEVAVMSKRAPVAPQAGREEPTKVTKAAEPEPGPAKTEDPPMPGNEDALKKELEVATAKARRADALLELPDDQIAFAKSLRGDARDAFLDATPEARAERVAKALTADPVVYKSLTGREFRKSHDPALVEMAKQLDDSNKVIAKQAAEAEAITFKSRFGSELNNLALEEAHGVALLRAVAGISDEPTRAAITKALQGANSTIATAMKRVGTTTGPAVGGDSKFATIVKKLRDADKNLSEHAAMRKALETPEGRAAYAEADDARREAEGAPAFSRS